MVDVKIYSVHSVSLSILKKNPPILHIDAKGKTRTSGYTNVRLEPRIYVKPPADGIYEFDFVATEPSGVAAQVLTDVEAAYDWDSYPDELKGVKLYAETNDIVEMLYEK